MVGAALGVKRLKWRDSLHLDAHNLKKIFFFFDINQFFHLQQKQRLRISIYELEIATEALSSIQ